MSGDLDPVGRLSFLGIDEGTRAALREFRTLLAQHIEPILDAFYGHVSRTPAANKVFTGHSLDHARRMQKQHWLDNVFTGTFNEDYFAQVAKIGRVHERVGLEPRWYIAGYCFIVNKLVDLAVVSYRKKPERLALIINAINKAAFLDMEMAITFHLDATREEAATLLHRHADDFERDVSSMVGVISSAATELQATAQSMATTAEETTQQASAVATAAEQASENVQTVAAATEELTASIQEISRQVSQSTHIAGSAVEEAQRTNIMVQGLAEAAGKIGQVVKLINDIASQTNLLALNATIEAARAGDAGKGFAVVAGEVKNLANQTAKATDEISAQIAAVQAATKDAVGAIQGIGNTISKISEIASAIAAAVEEQGAATQEIARNVQQAAMGTGAVTSNIGSVTHAAGETGHAAHEVLSAAGELSRQSERLSSQVDHFLTDVRSGH
jgi:methyl-accepting chemotaxis protein